MPAPLPAILCQPRSTQGWRGARFILRASWRLSAAGLTAATLSGAGRAPVPESHDQPGSVRRAIIPLLSAAWKDTQRWVPGNTGVLLHCLETGTARGSFTDAVWGSPPLVCGSVTSAHKAGATGIKPGQRACQIPSVAIRCSFRNRRSFSDSRHGLIGTFTQAHSFAPQVAQRSGGCSSKSSRRSHFKQTSTTSCRRNPAGGQDVSIRFSELHDRPRHAVVPEERTPAVRARRRQRAPERGRRSAALADRLRRHRQPATAGAFASNPSCSACLAFCAACSASM